MSLAQPVLSRTQSDVCRTRWRRIALAFVGVIAFALPCPAEPPPNFIIILADDMGYAGPSCFGNPLVVTPELDRLAAEGLRLTEFYASGTLCSPTRAGLLTGRYQQRAGIEAVIHPDPAHPEHRKGLQLAETTLAEALQSAGYATGLVGKWHLGYPINSPAYEPQRHGFEEFVGYHSGNIDYVSHVGDHNRHDWWRGRDEIHEDGYATELITAHATDFIRRHAAGDRPFLLYVAHAALHDPIQIPGDVVHRTEQRWDRWDVRGKSAEEIERKYRGMLLPLDAGIGELRQTVVDLGIESRTLILFFSDNGPAGEFPSGSPELRGGKGSTYEGGIKVPAIAWWPGRIAPGTTSNEPLISLDVMPTLLALAGAAPPSRPLDGVDISGVLLRGEELPERPLYWAALLNNGSRLEAVRQGDWKLVVRHPRATPGTFENELVELYHLPQDPAEARNLARRFPEKATELLNQWKSWYAETQSTATLQPGGWPNQ